MEPSAETIASAARAVGPRLSEALTLRTDAIADALAQQLQLVAWDREQLIGLVQTQLAALHRARPPLRRGPAVRVIEQPSQPLESIETAWAWLRRGRRVRVELEPGACTAATELLESMVPLLPEGALEVAGERGDRPAGYEDADRDPPRPRVAVIDEDADRELAAYVLARTGLRRSGVDPRGVKVAYAMGDLGLLERQMRRLWVGVRVGPAADPVSFTGPVTPEVRERFLEAHAQWHAHDRVKTWCRGGDLDRAGVPGCFLAPACFYAPWPEPALPLVGPMVVVVGCEDLSQLREAADAARVRGEPVVQIGGRPGSIPGTVRHVRGALLVERLPPGLPEPRPV